MEELKEFFQDKGINPFSKLPGENEMYIRQDYLIMFLEHLETERAKKLVKVIKQIGK